MGRRIAGKKGQEQYSTVTTMTAVIMIGIVLAGLTVGVVKWIKTRSAEQRCSLSSWMQDTADNYFVGVNLDCPAPHEDITSKNEIEAIRKIAMHLKTCWQKTGMGKRALLGTSKVKADRKCVVCSTFTLDRDVNVDDIVTYLETQPVPGHKDISYSEFLHTSLKDWQWEGELEGKEISISEEDSSKVADYAIFTPSFKNTEGDFLKSKDERIGNKKMYIVMVYRKENPLINIGWVIDWPFAKLGFDHFEKLKLQKEGAGFQTIYVVPQDNYKEIECDYLHWQKPEKNEGG